MAREPKRRPPPPAYQHNSEYQPRQGKIMPPEQRDNPVAVSEWFGFIASYDAVIDKPEEATQNREKTAHPIRRTSLKREQPNPGRGPMPTTKQSFSTTVILWFDFSSANWYSTWSCYTKRGGKLRECVYRVYRKQTDQKVCESTQQSEA